MSAVHREGNKVLGPHNKGLLKGGVFHGGSETKVVCLHGKRQSSGTKSLARSSSETNYGPGDRVMTAGGRNAFVEQICAKWLEETES